jgi:RNA polymerase sigma-70 factor (ECF subfamily)
MPLENETLLALLAKNLDHHYGRLMSAYWQQLHAFILRRTANPHDADDIVQEAFIRAYYALRRYAPEHIRELKMRPWLYKIAWNLYCNFAGRAKLPTSISLDLSEDSPFIEPEDDGNEQPEVMLEAAERRHELEALLNTLPPNYRDIISMCYLEELSYQEIADILNLPTGTVRVYAHRGLRLLRKTLEAQLK